MKRQPFLLTVVCLAVVVACWAGTVKQDVCEPYVQVYCGQAFGSGTVLKVNGEVLVLTAAHVVEDACQETRTKVLDAKGNVIETVERSYQPVQLVRKNGDGRREWQANIVLFSPVEESGGHDLALLKPVDADGLKAANFDAEAKPEEGDDCWYIGTPCGLHASLERTIFNQVDNAGPGGNRFYVVNGHGTYGNSGGGVFVKVKDEHRLVGVVCRIAGWEDGHGRSDKHCLLCQRNDTIAKFLALYKKDK